MAETPKTPEQNIEEKGNYLTGKLLLAMPNMGDQRFAKAVIYICAHNNSGAMGLVINHKIPKLGINELLKQLNISVPSENTTLLPKEVMAGGPVETARGFILHSNEFTQKDTIKVDEEFSVTGTIDALKAADQHGFQHNIDKVAEVTRLAMQQR